MKGDSHELLNNKWDILSFISNKERKKEKCNSIKDYFYLYQGSLLAYLSNLEATHFTNRTFKVKNILLQIPSLLIFMNVFKPDFFFHVSPKSILLLYCGLLI